MLLLDDFLETRATGRRNVAHTKISITFRVRLDHKSSSLSLSLSLFGCCLASKYPVARLSASISPRCRALFYVLHKSSSAHSLDRCNGGCSLLSMHAWLRVESVSLRLCPNAGKPENFVESRYTSPRSSRVGRFETSTTRYRSRMLRFVCGSDEIFDSFEEAISLALMLRALGYSGTHSRSSFQSQMGEGELAIRSEIVRFVIAANIKLIPDRGSSSAPYSSFPSYAQVFWQRRINFRPLSYRWLTF